MTGLDVSRKLTDKSIIVFAKSVSKSIPFACIFLSDVNKLRIVDFPVQDQERLAEIVRSTYAYGLEKEKHLDERCLEFHLQVISKISVSQQLLNPSL